MAVDRGPARRAARFGAAVAVALAISATGRAGQSGGTTRDYRYLMGTSIEVEAFGGEEAARRSAIDEAFGAIAEVDRLMSNYRSDSELAGVNRDAARQRVAVGTALFGVLRAAQGVSRESGGAFDVTIAPAVRAWGFHDHRPRVPSASELAAIRPLVDARNLVLDTARQTVAFARPGVELDLGGIAKGFAVELAAGVLRRHGLAGFIDAGGNQYLLGLPPGKRAWTVGIRNPDVADGLIGEVDTGETGVSTSGGYANFLTIDGRRYGHIIDPRTLRPADAALAVTVLARDGTMADAISTAAFVLGPAEGLALIDATPDVAGVIVYRKRNGTLDTVVSSGLRAAYHPVR